MNVGGGRWERPAQSFEVLDETLRDGLQSPSVTEPSLDAKKELLELMPQLGIACANLGLPAASAVQREHVTELARYIARRRLAVEAACATRTVADDVTAVVEAVQRSGHPIVAYCFIGASPIRLWAEDWDLRSVIAMASDAISLARREGLSVAFATEDTVRTPPAVLTPLFRAAIQAGAERLVLCDTVGHATREGAHALVSWTRELLAADGVRVDVEWHGHNDRGLALGNTLAALAAGADRVHACGLGIGERVGNTSMESLLLTLQRLEWAEHDLSALLPYVQAVSRACGVPLPPDHALAAALAGELAEPRAAG